MKLYFGFAVSDSMFGNVTIVRQTMSPEDAGFLLETTSREIVSCCNSSHVPTIEALRTRYPDIAIRVNIPEKPPLVKLVPGDALMVMSVRGLPRLEGRHEYTSEEITNASFEFSIWHVLDY